jgi:hypothetical protein
VDILWDVSRGRATGHPQRFYRASGFLTSLIRQPRVCAMWNILLPFCLAIKMSPGKPASRPESPMRRTVHERPRGLAASKEIRDAVLSSGMGYGVTETFDRRAALL